MGARQRLDTGIKPDKRRFGSDSATGDAAEVPLPVLEVDLFPTPQSGGPGPSLRVYSVLLFFPLPFFLSLSFSFRQTTLDVSLILRSPSTFLSLSLFNPWCQ
jgi:hypothetical protein